MQCNRILVEKTRRICCVMPRSVFNVSTAKAASSFIDDLTHLKFESLPIKSLTVSREQHVPDSSNHSRYLNTPRHRAHAPELFRTTSPLHEHTHTHKTDTTTHTHTHRTDRITKKRTTHTQHIVHRVWGSKIHALTRSTLKTTVGCMCTYPSIHFHCAFCARLTANTKHFCDAIHLTCDSGTGQFINVVVLFAKT